MPQDTSGNKSAQSGHRRTPQPREQHLSGRKLKEMTADDPDRIPLARAIIFEILEWSVYFLIIFLVYIVLKTFMDSVFQEIAEFFRSIGRLFGL